MFHGGSDKNFLDSKIRMSKLEELFDIVIKSNLTYVKLEDSQLDLVFFESIFYLIIQKNRHL